MWFQGYCQIHQQSGIISRDSEFAKALEERRTLGDFGGWGNDKLVLIKAVIIQVSVRIVVHVLLECVMSIIFLLCAN